MEQYSDEKLKRGVDLQNRAWDTTGKTVGKLFSWWRGGRINRTTLLLIALLLGINTYMTWPLMLLNTTPAFAGSVSLRMVAASFAAIGIAPRIFFAILVQGGLGMAVVVLYLFVRKLVHRHELTAFFATFFFIVPNPLFGSQSVLVSSVLQGDGAHVITFPLVLLSLLYLRSFVAFGTGGFAVLAILGGTIVALLSPFSLFNFFVIGFILAVGEGFVGNMRIKLARYGFLLLCVFGLSLFWYYPHFVQQVLFQHNLSGAFGKLWSVLPLAVPLIPILGTLSFLIFDRRPVLNPIFVSLGVFTIYFALFTASRLLNTSGIFVASRYILEMSFALSFFGALIAVLGIEYLYIKLHRHIAKQHALVGMLTLFSISFIAFFTLFLLLSNVQEAHAEALHDVVQTGLGGTVRMTHLLNFRDIGSDIALFVSLAVAALLLPIARMSGAKLAAK